MPRYFMSVIQAPVESDFQAAPADWLPDGKKGAVCFSIDDVRPGVQPGRSADAHESGVSLDRGVLRRLHWLLDRHALFEVTLFTTPDWREISPFRDRKWVSWLPVLRNRLYWSRVHPKGTMRVDRHLDFVNYLRSMPRTRIGVHGCYHVQRGPNFLAEFKDRSIEDCQDLLRTALGIFHAAGLPVSFGVCPPCWHASPALIEAMASLGFRYLASARDVRSPIRRDTVARMSGLAGASLLYPELIGAGRLVHITSNFAANNPVERALEILGQGGLLAIKAHCDKYGFGHVSVDGLDELYCNYLDALLNRIEDQFQNLIWWTSMEGVADRVLALSRIQPRRIFASGSPSRPSSAA